MNVQLADDVSAMLHDARLLMTMLAERGQLKATAKGNLPREFVREFRDRMRDADVRDNMCVAFEVHLKEGLLLPIVHAAVPPPPPSLPEFDAASLLLEFRVLLPLVRFGLAEAREPARGPGIPFERTAYRKLPLFDRFLMFHLGGNAEGRPL